MKEIELLLVNAFTHDGKGGNPAGVVLEASTLTATDRQQIAKEVGLSETAFVSSSDVADYSVEFFTPTDQVAMCGHATIATWSVLRDKNNLSTGHYTQALLNGALGVELLDDGSVVMEQKLPQYGKIVKADELTSFLGLAVTDFITVPQPQLVSTGMYDVMVGVKRLEILDRIKPNFEAISQFQSKHNEAGLHVFALDDADEKAVARMRDFCPFLGIPEESATGSATGALLCYLYYYGLLSDEQVSEGVWFEQGYSMNRPSDIFGKLTVGEDRKIEKVEIGGKATIVSSQKIDISM